MRSPMDDKSFQDMILEQIMKYNQMQNKEGNPEVKLTDRFSPAAIAILEGAYETLYQYKKASEVLDIPLENEYISGPTKGIIDLLRNVGLTEDHLSEYARYVGKR